MGALLTNTRRGSTPARSFTESHRPEEGNDVRWRLVAKVRQQIAEGTYDSPQRMDEAMDKLLSELGA